MNKCIFIVEMSGCLNYIKVRCVRMKKIAIIYFSGTGNTKFIAENLKLEITNQKVDLINIERDRLNPEEYESIIIGGPVYAERYPEILLKYIEENLNKYNGKCMLFTTQASKNETYAFQHAINRLDFLNITYCMYVTMPNNFYNFMFKMSSKEEKMLIRQSVKLIRRGIEEFFNDAKKFYPKKKINVDIIDIVYNLVYPYYINYLTKKINIDVSKCSNCKLCEKRCPVNCIKITDRATFNSNCIFCQRCMCNCPNEAFLYKNKKFIQYRPNFREYNKSLD